MNKWTHRRTHITETYIPIDNPSSSVSSSSDNLHAKKVKPGFHAELINNKNAAKWLESTMTTDLAKLHLYNLFLDIRRLQGHEVKFGPDICNKIRLLSRSAPGPSLSNIFHDTQKTPCLFIYQ